jgi:hypothetical protein
MELDFCGEINRIFDEYLEVTKSLINLKNDPELNSQANSELVDPIYKNHIASSIAMIISLREIAADNLMGIQRLLISPIMSFAPFVLFRGLVEVAALSLWFSSTSLNAKERTERYFIYRHDSLIQQIKFINSDENHEKTIEIQQNLEKLKNNAEAIGLNITTRHSDKIIIKQMPKRIEIIKDMLDAESTYRLFSAISHGQHWAYFSSSFKKGQTNVEIYPGIKGGIIEKNIEPIALIYLCKLSIIYLTKSEIEQFKYFGWDTAQLIQLLHQLNTKIEKIVKLYNL